MGPADDLVGRAEALRALDAAIAAVPTGGGPLLVVDAPAGLGKTRLLGAAAARAPAAGLRPLRMRGRELERHLAWGGCAELLEEALAGADDAERARWLAGPGAPAAGLLDERGLGTATAELPVLHAIAWVVAGTDAPALVLADDVQWLDEPSLRALAFLAERRVPLGVGIACARRTGEPTPHAALLDHLAALPGARAVALPPLEGAEVDAAVRQRLPGADARTCRLVAEATAGNPLHVRQLADTLAAEGDAADPDRILTLAPLGLAGQVALRLRALGPDAVAVARAVAVLVESAPVAVVTALAGLTDVAGTAAASALARADVLADDVPLRFVHPLVRRAVLGGLAAPERAALHADGARVLHATGAPATLVAAQLLGAEPGLGAWAVDALAGAADRAARTAAPSAAAALLERALREPLEPARRTDLVVALSRATTAAGRPAPPELEDALLEIADPLAEARLRLELGSSEHHAGDFDASAETFARGLARLPVGHDELAEALQAGRLASGLLSGAHAAEAHALVARWLDDAAEDRPTAGRRGVLSGVLTQRLFAGTTPADELLAGFRRLGGLELVAEETTDSQALWHVVGARSWLEDPDVEDWLDACFADARARASVLGFAMSSYARSWPRLWRGDVAGSAADAEAAMDAWAGGAERYRPAAAYYAALAHAERDDADAVGRIAADLASRPEPRGAMWPFAEQVRALRAGAHGQHAAALAAHRSAGAAIAALGVLNPVCMPWRSQASAAALALGDRELASALAREEVELARTYAAPRPLGIALAAHGAATGSLDDLAAAVELLAEGPGALDHARARVLLGAALRRAGQRRQAREVLAGALEDAHRFGARRTASRARDELLASGARPRREVRTGPDALTPAERRVADLAATGLSNREIAGRLFVTVSTVEWHLRQVFAKVQIASRRELGAALGPSA